MKTVKTPHQARFIQAALLSAARPKNESAMHAFCGDERKYIGIALIMKTSKNLFSRFSSLFRVRF